MSRLPQRGGCQAVKDDDGRGKSETAGSLARSLVVAEINALLDLPSRRAPLRCSSGQCLFSVDHTCPSYRRERARQPRHHELANEISSSRSFPAGVKLFSPPLSTTWSLVSGWIRPSRCTVFGRRVVQCPSFHIRSWRWRQVDCLAVNASSTSNNKGTTACDQRQQHRNATLVETRRPSTVERLDRLLPQWRSTVQCRWTRSELLAYAHTSSRLLFTATTLLPPPVQFRP